MANLPAQLAQGRALEDILGGGAPSPETPETEAPEGVEGRAPEEDIRSGLDLVRAGTDALPASQAERIRSLIASIEEVLEESVQPEEEGREAVPSPEEAAKEAGAATPGAQELAAL